ncbi:MAG: trimeric intracellular cation channel family protein [Thiotrichales bacterium]
MKLPPEFLYWLTQSAVAVSAAAAVLEAGKKRFDLFGVLVIALAAALGGGSLRDMLLDRPVFWVVDQTYLLVAILAGLVTFFVARWVSVAPRVFLVPDAAGLALFSVAGTQVALGMHAPWLVASFLGVVTGVMGGVIRDVLCNEEPLVFRGELYATVAWLGTLLLLGLLAWRVDPSVAAVVAGVCVFLARLAAIRWRIGLPSFRER